MNGSRRPTREHPAEDEHRHDDLPKARITRNWKTHFFWLIPIGAAALAAYFVYEQFIATGPTIHILFDDAQELQAGKSEVRYLGAQIGTVKEIKLTPDNKHVEITCELNGDAKNVAREGSKFWIVHAHIALEEIRAARTIVSGNYITVEPGTGKQEDHFTGLAEAPVMEDPGDINVVLISGKLGSVKLRTPVFYRGIQVGEVRLCELGRSSQDVHMTVQIKKHYAPLVRMNSKFWNAGGINFNLSLSGMDLSAQSAQTLLAGGIAFSTPDIPQAPAVEGTVFRLYDKPEEEWLAWAPEINLEGTNQPAFFQSNPNSP